MKSWKTLARNTTLDQGKFLRVEDHTVQLPDGKMLDHWPWVITPDFVNVAVITKQQEWVVFQQTKYAVEGISLAPVGGYLEADEDPLEAAKRETLEETGYEAATWIDLGHYAVDGNRGAGTAYAFLAMNATSVAVQPDSDDLEEQKLLLLSRQQIEEAIFANQFKVLPWTNVIVMALLWLNQHGDDL